MNSKLYTQTQAPGKLHVTNDKVRTSFSSDVWEEGKQEQPQNYSKSGTFDAKDLETYRVLEIKSHIADIENHENIELEGNFKAI